MQQRQYPGDPRNEMARKQGWQYTFAHSIHKQERIGKQEFIVDKKFKERVIDFDNKWMSVCDPYQNNDAVKDEFYNTLERVYYTLPGFQYPGWTRGFPPRSNWKAQSHDG